MEFLLDLASDESSETHVCAAPGSCTLISADDLPSADKLTDLRSVHLSNVLVSVFDSVVYLRVLLLQSYLFVVGTSSNEDSPEESSHKITSARPCSSDGVRSPSLADGTCWPDADHPSSSSSSTDSPHGTSLQLASSLLSSSTGRVDGRASLWFCGSSTETSARSQGSVSFTSKVRTLVGTKGFWTTFSAESDDLLSADSASDSDSHSSPSQ